MKYFASETMGSDVEAETPVLRQKHLGRRPSGVFHAAQYEPVDGVSQADRVSDSATAHADSGSATNDTAHVGSPRVGSTKLDSQFRERARVIGLYLLQEAVDGWSSTGAARGARAELPALVDASRQVVDKRWNGDSPWPIEYFVMFAYREPQLAARTALAFCRILPREALITVRDGVNALIAASDKVSS